MKGDESKAIANVEEDLIIIKKKFQLDEVESSVEIG